MDSPARNANKNCTDYYSPDCPDDAHFNKTQLESFGTYEGHDIFVALKNAAKRGVRIRIVQSPGLGNGFEEPEALKALSPKVEVRTMDFTKWYHSGIMHAKVWVADGKHAYVGSANMDWRSLTQTRETGVLVHSCDVVVRDLSNIFESFWKLASLEDKAEEMTRTVYDPHLEINRLVPCWSHLVDPSERCGHPFEMYPSRPMPVKVSTRHLHHSSPTPPSPSSSLSSSLSLSFADSFAHSFADMSLVLTWLSAAAGRGHDHQAEPESSGALRSRAGERPGDARGDHRERQRERIRLRLGHGLSAGHPVPVQGGGGVPALRAVLLARPPREIAR